jgi:formylglycine-generating enzyme required for sulfatase activity
MGSPESELREPAQADMFGGPEPPKGRFGGEGPQHKVEIVRPFAIGRFAVTFDEWDACVADGGCNGYRPYDGGWGRGHRPVINVSWHDAQQYVAWLSSKTGETYRLLSEAEWEYAARAGTTTPFWWGTAISTDHANYDDRYDIYGNATKGGFRHRTVPVDLFQPNPWDLYQVHGNVWEWTEDCYHDNYHGAPTDGSARTIAGCKSRVLRGGSWINDPWYLRAAFRYWDSPDNRNNYSGFRVGRTLTLDTSAQTA